MVEISEESRTSGSGSARLGGRAGDEAATAVGQNPGLTARNPSHGELNRSRPVAG